MPGQKIRLYLKGIIKIYHDVEQTIGPAQTDHGKHTAIKVFVPEDDL